MAKSIGNITSKQEQQQYQAAAIPIAKPKPYVPPPVYKPAGNPYGNVQGPWSIGPGVTPSLPLGGGGQATAPAGDYGPSQPAPFIPNFDTSELENSWRDKLANA